MIAKTGALESPKDDRDWTLASVGVPITYVQACFLLIEWMKVSMQKQIGCCVGCTGEEVVRKIVHDLFGTQDELSWRFVYAMAKCLEGINHPVYGDFRAFSRTTGANDGTYPSLVAQIIRKIGVPLAKFCPNNADLSADDFCYGRDITKIPADAIADASKRKSGADLNVPVSVDGIKRAINYCKANGGGVMILRRVGDTYWKGKDGVNTWAKSKLLPLQVPKIISSGHEELLYGYLDITKQDRADLIAQKITIESLIAKYPETAKLDTNRTDTVIFWLNHWSDSWCSTSGNINGTRPTDHDGGRGWEFLDEWLPLIGEIRAVVASVPVVNTFKYIFTKDLKLGDKGVEVVALQHALKLQDCFEYDSFTGNFGTITRDGVIKFQQKYASEILAPIGLKNPTGIIGSMTRKKLNQLYSN